MKFYEPILAQRSISIPPKIFRKHLFFLTLLGGVQMEYWESMS